LKKQRDHLAHRSSRFSIKYQYWHLIFSEQCFPLEPNMAISCPSVIQVKWYSSKDLPLRN